MHADATIYIADLDAGQTAEFATGPSRCVCVHVTAGNWRFNGERIKNSDQARIANTSRVRLRAHDATSSVLIDVPTKERLSMEMKE